MPKIFRELPVLGQLTDIIPSGKTSSERRIFQYNSLFRFGDSFELTFLFHQRARLAISVQIYISLDLSTIIRRTVFSFSTGPNQLVSFSLGCFHPFCSDIQQEPHQSATEEHSSSR